MTQNDGAGGIRHHFTVDVEEYFQVAALAPFVARDTWDARASRVEIGTRLLLNLMAERGAQGTFFTLGWVAKRQPQLIRDIAAAGHEIASHGWGHEKVTDLSKDQFRESVRDSKSELEAVSGQSVVGYRAPSFSIVRGYEWALDILAEEGYEYDSSLFSVRRAGYGWVGGGRDPYRLDTRSGALDEFPPATVRVGSSVLPAGGGAYFRLLPYALTHAGMASAAARGAPGTFYIHPWELDPGQPRIDVPMLTRIRHYGGVSGAPARVRRLLCDFRFQTIADTRRAAHGYLPD